MSYRKSEGNAVFLIDKIPQTNTNAPMVAVGKVVITKTAERESTQNPMTGFVCDGTPLGKGHIIALFLGGPDIKENYAPQYEQWQQGGAWKTMEEEIKALSQTTGNSVDLYMVVKLTYGNTGNTYKKLEEDARARFGFKDNEYFSPDTWKTDSDNAKKLRDAVKTQLNTRTDHYGVKLADYSKLAGGNIVASNTISAYLTN